MKNKNNARSDKCITNKSYSKRDIISIIVATVILVLWIPGISLLALGLYTYESCTLNDRIKKYNDIEIYTQQKYLNEEEFGAKVRSTGANAKSFLPIYEEIAYNYSNLDFYIFDGTNTLWLTAVTLVLDLKFDDKNEYETAKKNEMSTQTFITEYETDMGEKTVLEFEAGNFVCKTVSDKNYPRRFGLLCLNDKESILRYLYFEEWESPEYVKSKEDILECTNCPWE